MTDGLTTGLIYKFRFRAINLVGAGEDSDIVEYALVDVPSAPSAPVVMLSHTTEDQVAVEWGEVASLQAPGSDVTGYVLEMKDTSDLYGTFEQVFDGGDLYPFLRNHLQSGVVAGNNYLFRAKAKYQNGYTSYS